MRVCLLLLCCALTALGEDETTAPVQPIPFSHKQHATAASLQCIDCHKTSASGEVETLPKAKACMACHQSVKTDSSEIKNLRSYADSNRPIPWARVYEIPGFVNFNHKTHSDGGVSCEACHGNVKERARLWRETDISMSGCVTCHQARKASVGCGVCHDLQH